MPILLLAAGLGALWLLHRGSARPSQQQTSTTPKTPATSQAKSDGGGASSLVELGVQGASALGASAPVAAAAVAYTLAGAELGKELTGDTAGQIAGGLNPVVGNIGNAGRLAGKEIDRAFGGDGGGLSGTVAQVGGFIVFGVGGIFAASGFGIIFALPFMFGLTTLVAPLWLLAVGVSDLQRLAYGQEGALADFEAERSKVLNQVRTQIRAFVDARRPPGMSDTERDRIVERMAVPFADGYIRKWNALRYAQWMARPHGVLNDNRAHCIFGRDRGYFVGDAGPNGELVETWAPPSWGAEHLQNVPAAELVTVEVDVYEWFELPVKGSVAFPAKFARESAPFTQEKTHPWLNVTDGFMSSFDERQAVADGYAGTRWERRKTGTEKRSGDPAVGDIAESSTVTNKGVTVPTLQRTGAIVANVTQYVLWMAEPRGFQQSESSHAVYGRDQGRFEGSIVSGKFTWKDDQGAVKASGDGGILNYGGQQYFWKTPKGLTGVILKPNPPIETTSSTSTAQKRAPSLTKGVRA